MDKTLILVLALIIPNKCSSYITSADPEDPVLQEALSAEGSGWRLADELLSCELSEPRLTGRDCAGAIQQIGGCESQEDEFFASRMLILCRKECRNYYNHTGTRSIPEEIISYGGLDDFLDQPFGFKLPICSMREGYTAQMLDKPINFFNYIPEYIFHLIPALTKDGFKKVEIPSSLYEKILEMRKKSLERGHIIFEDLDPGILNGPVLIDNPDLGKSKLMMVNRTQMIKVDQETRKVIFSTLGPLAEEWAGGLKLIPTSIYGIRR